MVSWPDMRWEGMGGMDVLGWEGWDEEMGWEGGRAVGRVGEREGGWE